MQIDPRLDQIDDCLYRVSTKAMIIRGNKVLLVKELPEEWWGFPGGGIDHGEAVESSLPREVEEELGVPAQFVSTDFKIAHYTIGTVSNGIPRMNLFYKVSLPEELLKQTAHVAEWGWFTKEEFLNVYMSPSYDGCKDKLAQVIFGDLE